MSYTSTSRWAGPSVGYFADGYNPYGKGHFPTADEFLAHAHSRCDPSRGICCPACTDAERVEAKIVQAGGWNA